MKGKLTVEEQAVVKQAEFTVAVWASFVSGVHPTTILSAPVSSCRGAFFTGASAGSAGCGFSLVSSCPGD
jgi:hypothetical protein